MYTGPSSEGVPAIRDGFYRTLARSGRPRSYLGKFVVALLVGSLLPLVGVLLALALGLGPAATLLLCVAAALTGLLLALAWVRQLLEPVHSAGRALRAYLTDGVLLDPPETFDDEAGRLLRDVQRTLASLDEKRRRLDYRAKHDLDTGLYTRRVAESLIGTHIALAERKGAPLCAALLAIDGFDELERSGERGAADAALRRVGEQVRVHLRESDWAARWDDGTLLMLLFTDAEGAEIALERVRGGVMAADGEPLVTVSAGLSEARGDAAGLLERAAAALERARARGPNRIDRVLPDG